MSNELSHTAPRRLPLATLLLTAVAVLLSVFPALSEMFAYDRAAIVAGELWRLAGGQVVHWNVDHLVWDVLMLAVLGAWIETRSRRALLLVLGASTLAINLALWCGLPQVAHYRGLSGIDTALFTFVACDVAATGWRQGRRFATVVSCAAAVGVVAKIAYEIATGSTLFVDSAAAGFTPLPWVHAAGGLAGGVVGFFEVCRGTAVPQACDGEPVACVPLRCGVSPIRPA